MVECEWVWSSSATDGHRPIKDCGLDSVMPADVGEAVLLHAVPASAVINCRPQEVKPDWLYPDRPYLKSV